LVHVASGVSAHVLIVVAYVETKCPTVERKTIRLGGGTDRNFLANGLYSLAGWAAAVKELPPLDIDDPNFIYPPALAKRPNKSGH